MAPPTGFIQREGSSNVSTRTRNYLDHAATSWPKAESVYVAMDRYARDVGAAAGRGEYQAAMAASDVIASCRRELMRWINAEDAKQIAFFSSGTTALNAAIFGTLRAGDHVVTTAIEHNSVLRPLEALRERGKIGLTIIECDAMGKVDVERLLGSIDSSTAMVAMAHASNVTGAVQDVAAVGERISNTPTVFLCDAAQTLGYLPIDVRTLGVDLFAAPGHKGAGGPLGTALLYVSPKAATRLRPTLYGGTGSVSESLRMPTQMPQMLEAGNLNVPAIAGWDAGLKQLRSRDAVAREQHLTGLCERMSHAFAGFDRGFAVMGNSLPIASLVFDEADPSLVGSLLDSEYSIDVRCGLHCAALIHEAIRQVALTRTGRTQHAYRGTLRLSAGHFTTAAQIDAAAAAIDDLLSEL